MYKRQLLALLLAAAPAWADEVLAELERRSGIPIAELQVLSLIHISEPTRPY